MNSKAKVRNIVFILIGAVVLLSKKYFSGPGFEFVHSYLGNVSISFSVYFLAGINAKIWNDNKLLTAAVALLAVELFELTNGFGIMRNTFDIYDLIANIVGVGLALSIDLLVDRTISQKGKN